MGDFDDMSYDELKHYGIKGMKWGVRRFQNKDGSLTADGRKRYGSEDLKSMQKQVNQGKNVVDGVKKTRAKAAEKQTEKKIRDDLSKMSDRELRDIVNRLNMEERYMQVMKSRDVVTGKSKVDKILDYAGTALTIGGSALSIMVAMKELQK